MAKRPQQTLMDYMVIGVSPALIMMMVGSLLFYLLTVFYHGHYEGRLTFIFAMFVMAIVLIARISMEEGIEYATLFAVPLAMVTLLAMSRFVQFRGSFADFSMIINLVLVAVVWWSAHKLTWDCTLIDDSQDASGEGLLQGMGFDADTLARQAETESADRSEELDEAEQGSRKQRSAGTPLWWQRMIDRRHRPHTPGVWVIYYALAALPLFALGQWLVPASATSARLSAFRLLVIYVGSALGLLLTTSFLGLRRYLRQRKLEMPLDMAGVWLGIGSVLILVVLLLCMFLPRPGAALKTSQLPFQLESPQQTRTDRNAVGNDGTQQGQTPRSTHSEQSGSEQSGSEQSGSEQSGSEQSEDQQTSGQQSGEKGAQQSANGAAKSSGQESNRGKGSQQKRSQSSQHAADKAGTDRTPQGKSQQNVAQNNRAQQGKSQQGEDAAGNTNKTPERQRNGDTSRQQKNSATGKDDRSSSESSRQSSSPEQKASGAEKSQQRNDQANGGGDSSKSADQSEASNRQGGDQESNSSNEQASSESSKADSPPSSSPSNRDVSQPRSVISDTLSALSGVMGGVGGLLKVIFWAALLIGLGYLCWRHWERLAQAIQQLITDLCNLWARLFGREARDDTPNEDASLGSMAMNRPFSSYSDPFLDGRAERYSIEQLVVYTFDALQAWGRERGSAREDEHTPLEFARLVAVDHPQLGQEVQQLADLYSRVAYGKERVRAERRDLLSRLWQLMRVTESMPAPPPSQAV